MFWSGPVNSLIFLENLSLSLQNSSRRGFLSDRWIFFLFHPLRKITETKQQFSRKVRYFLVSFNCDHLHKEKDYRASYETLSGDN